MKPCAKLLKRSQYHCLALINPAELFSKHHSLTFSQAPFQHQAALTCSPITSLPSKHRHVNICWWLSANSYDKRFLCCIVTGDKKKEFSCFLWYPSTGTQWLQLCQVSEAVVREGWFELFLYSTDVHCKKCDELLTHYIMFTVLRRWKNGKNETDNRTEDMNHFCHDCFFLLQPC